MPRVRRGIVPVVIYAVVAAGCGSSGKNDKTPRLTRAESQALTAQLERARVTAAAHDLAGTKASLIAFKGAVAKLRRAGALSDATARSLSVGAARALARATSDSAPPPILTQTAPAPPSDEGNGNGNGTGGDGGD
jgi:hypothetical protein